MNKQTALQVFGSSLKVKVFIAVPKYHTLKWGEKLVVIERGMKQ